MSERKTDGGPRLPAALAFFGPLVLYAWTAARTVQGGDAAEFGLIGLKGGVAHPPGYPLYSLLLRLFGHLPINPPFFRVALTSVVCGAAAAFVVYRVCWRLTRSAPASLLTALAFAVAPLPWRLAGIPEVFSLHALMVALAMLFTIRLSQATAEERPREALALGLVAGLALANHLTIVLCAPLFLGAVAHGFVTDGTRAGARNLALMTVATLVGLLPYFLLMPWAHVDPGTALIWGRTGTLKGLLAHVLRREYGTFSLHADKNLESPVGTAYVGRALKTLVVDYQYVFFLVGLWGAWLMVRARKIAAFVLLACLFLSAIVFPSLITFTITEVTVEVAERFFLMPLVLFTPFVAWGLSSILSRYGSLRLILPVVLVAGLAAGWHRATWRHDTILQQYVVAITKNLPPNSVIIGSGDNLLTAMEWRRLVLGVRPDVKYVDPFTLRGGWYYERIRQQLPGVPVPYDEVLPHVADMGALLTRYRPAFYLPWLVGMVKDKTPVTPWGLLYRVDPGGAALSVEAQRILLEKDTQALGGPLPEPVDAWNAETVHGVLTPWAQLSETFMAAGRTADAEAALHRIADILPPSLRARWTAGEGSH